MVVRPPPLVVSPCSARKRPSSVAITIRGLSAETQEMLAKQWLALLRRARQTYPAVDVYRGRGFRTAVAAAAEIGADVAVVSLGLGYVPGDVPIPVYDLTMRDSGNASILERLRDPFDVNRWWAAVLRGPFSQDPVTDMLDRPAIYACLSASYASLLIPALLAYLERSPTGRLRLFGETLAKALPKRLHNYVMPYDQRLNAIGYPGARFDFAHRALLHYSREIFPQHLGSLSREVHAIEGSLKKGTLMTRPLNQRATDGQIKDFIRRLYGATGMSRTKMLEHLRHVEKISCEQSRFADLYRETIKQQ